jgi:hypothetical protein
VSDDLSYLDQFVTGAPASAPPTPEQTTTPPEKDLSYLDQFLPPQIARQNQITAEGKNPEEAAKAFNLAPKVGLPPSIVGMNPQAFEQQATRAQNNTLTDANPALAHFVSDPNVAAAVSDDYPALAQVAAAFNPGGALGLEPGDMVGDEGPIAAFLKGGVQSGYAHAAYGSLGLGSMLGFNNEAKLKDYENQFEREKRYEGVDKFAASLGGVVGGLAHNVETGVVGAVGGAALGPGGAAAGFLAGSVGDFFASSVGTLYRQQESVRDENGKRIPEPIKIAAALAGGTIATGVGIGLGAAGGRIVGGLVSRGITSVMSRPGVVQALGQFVGGTTEAAVTGGAINAGIAVAQEATPILVREMAGININDPTQWDKVADHAGEAFLMGSALFGATHGAMTALPIGMNYLADRATITQTRAEGEQRLSILNAMQISKTTERSQELMRQYVEQQNFPDIHIPVEIADKNRDALSYVPDLDQQIARAGAVGGDVKISAADYFTKTDPTLQGTLNEDVRGPSGLTMREVEELEKNPPDYATVYHGSPHSFEAFDIGKIGTGEGAQAYGHGLYFAERRGIAEDYRDQLSGTTQLINGQPVDFGNPQHLATKMLEFTGDIDEAIGHASAKVADAKIALKNEIDDPDFDLKFAQEELKLSQETLKYLQDDKSGKAELPHTEYSTGHLYQAKIMRPKEHFLDWDAPLEQQSPYVQEALKKAGYEGPPKEGTPISPDNPSAPALDALPPLTGEDIIRHMGGKGPETTAKLSEAGIAGIKYLDAASRDSNKERLEGWQATLSMAEENLADLKKEQAEGKSDVSHLINMVEGDIETAKKEIERYSQPETRNFVVFNDKDVLITHKNDVARQIEEALATTTEQIEASMGLRKPLENAEKKPLWLDPLVEAKAVGVPKNTFAQLSRNIQEMQRKITQAAFDAAERELKRRDTPRWKADLAEETEKARTEMEKRPDFKAWYGLVDLPKNDPFSVKIDRNETDALYNRESPGDYAAFQKDGTRASESLPAKMFAKTGEEGLHPDVAAEMFGFNSGKDMLDMLRKHEANIRESGLPPAKYFDGLYKAEGRRRMEAKFGNLQENIMKEAIALALDVKQIDVLTTEIEALGGEKITKQRVLDDVRDKATAYTASELKSNFFMRQTGKFGKAAFEAVVGKKYPEALENKLKQLTSFAMAREAKAFEAEKARLEKVMDRFGKNGVVNGVDQRFTDRIHQVLDKVQMPIPRTVGNLIDALVDDNGKPTTFHEFVNTLQAKTGLEVPVADVISADGRKAYSEMTVGEVRQLKDTLLSLEEHGRAINSVIVNGQKEALNRVIEDVILPHMDTMEKKRDERPRTPWAQLKKGGRFIDAALLRAEQMFQWLDKNDPFGPMTTLVYRPLKQAEYNFLDHYKAFADDWNKGVSIDRAWKKTLSQKTKNNWLEDEDGDKMTLYRDNMIAMAANVGNEWNMRVLAGGRKWHPDDIMAYLHENMTKKDWEIVQSIWDRFEKLWPDVRDASKARTGIAVERIPSREVITPHGTFKGGYYPLIAEAEAAKGTRQTLFGRDQKQTFRTLTSISNATNARTGAVYPVDLSLDRLPYAIRETLHEIHFGETLTNVAKIAQDPLVLKGIRGALGKDYADSIQPWLEYIAHDGGNVDPGALGWLTSGSRYLRQNMVTQLVGFRPSTGFIHGASAAANSWAELGRQNITDQKYLTEALSLLARDPATGDRWATVYKNESGELRHRSHTMERDMRGVIMRDLSQPSGLGRILGDQFDRAMYQTLATKHIAYLDYMSALVVYAAKRAEGLAKGLSLDDAIFAAEQTVRNAHGSAGLMDLPAIARGNEAMKWFTTFYGYFNHNYNRLRDTGRFVKGMNPLSPADYWQVVSRSMGYLVVPAIVHEALRAPPPKPDESYLWWVTKGVGSQIAGGFPFIRDGAHSLVQGKLPEASTPLSEVFKGLARPFKDVHDYEVGREPHDWLGNAVALPGWLTGHLPGATRTGPGRLISGLTSHTGSGVAQWLWDQGLHTPQSWDVDYMRLLLEGNAHPRRGH